MKRHTLAACAALAFLFALLRPADAQWRIATPRDTVYVDAKGSPVNGKIQLSLGTDFYLQISGTYSFFPSQPKDGIDADYTYKVPGWNLFNPLVNPPTYNSALFDWGLYIDNTTTKGYYKDFAPADVYQSSHNYALRFPSQANHLQFRIKAPSTAYYNSATGGLTIKSARWTAGIAVENRILDFGSVLVGQPMTLLDSIASYGIDPLQIDSVAIQGISPVGNDAFSVISQRGSKFSLPTESTNEFRVTAIPDTLGDITGEMRIYSHNTDASNRIIHIQLHVFGISPKLGVGPSAINFHLVRIGTGAFGTAFISNTGNSNLTVTNADYLPKPPPADTGVFAMSFPLALPFDVTPHSIGQIRTIFTPKKREHYHAKLYIKGKNVPQDSVDLQGDGAEPVPMLSDSVLSFGIVYRDDDSVRTLTLTNKGNWPCTVINAFISGPTKSSFSFVPSDTAFFLPPDSSRTFTITFHPGAGLQGFNYQAYFNLVYDDNSTGSVLLTGTEKEPLLTYSSHEYDFGKVKIGASATRTVASVLNTSSSSNADIWDQHITPVDQYFTQDPPLPSKVPAAATLPVQVKFAPLVQGAFQSYLYVNANGKLDVIHLLGIGAIAKALFNPSPLAYGIVKSDSTDTLVTMLHDSGDYALRAIRIEITGADANDFKVLYQPTGMTPILPYTIEEDSTMPIEVSFVTHARTGAVHKATLCVYYDDSTSDCIPLEAIEEAQYLQFGQSSLDFGKVRVKTTATKDAFFNNRSGKSLKVDTVTISGAPFAVLNQLGPIAAGDSGAVNVSFTPPARGTYTAYLRGRGGDFRNDSIQVRGTGAAPLPVFLPDTVIDFGIVQLGAQKQEQRSLANIGDWALRTVDARIVGDPIGEFSFSKDRGGDPKVDTVDVGSAPSSYTVTFTPSQPLVYHAARLVFTFDDGSQGTIYLKGYDESPYLVLDADTINFGKVRIGSVPTDSVHLVSTSTDTLTAYNVSLAGSPEFTASPLSPTMRVMPRTLQGIGVTFKPLTIGSFAAKLTMINDSAKHPDTTFIYGIGAKPIPAFFADSSRIDTLDFGAMFNGYTSSRTIVLADSGNWDITTLGTSPTGVNGADFTPNFPAQFTIPAGGAKTLSITYQASTPYQAAPRLARMDFLLDDSSTFTLYLKAQDIAPISTAFKFDNASIRPSDIVYPNLRLRTTLPDSLKIDHISGVINWDPAVASLVVVDQSALLKQTGKWILTPKGGDPPGQYTYDLDATGRGGYLSTPMPLLQLQFRTAPAAQAGMQTTLRHSWFTFPARTEVTAVETQGVLVVDSACGNTHLVAGAAEANFIEMNMPNPFGAGGGNEVTTIPFNIANDGTPVTIRILDITGREVLRPINNQTFAQGFYELKLSGHDIPNSGTYLYEFSAGHDAPVVRKMLVRK